MINLDNKNTIIHVISDTNQMLDLTCLSNFYTMIYNDGNLEISINNGYKIVCPITESELEYIQEINNGEDLYTINIIRKVKWIKDTKVDKFITMHDIDVEHKLYSIERLSNLFSENSLDLLKSETHIAKIESLFQVLRTNGGSIDTIAKFYNIEGFYILDECKLHIEPTKFEVNQILNNVTLAPFKDITEFTPEGIILNNGSLRYPAIIKYSGKAIKF